MRMDNAQPIECGVSKCTNAACDWRANLGVTQDNVGEPDTTQIPLAFGLHATRVAQRDVDFDYNPFGPIWFAPSAIVVIHSFSN